MMGQRKLTGRMSDRDNGLQETRKMRGERFITPGEVLPSRRLRHLCLRPSAQVVLSVKAKRLSGPDCPGGQADRDPRRRGLKSL